MAKLTFKSVKAELASVGITITRQITGYWVRRSNLTPAEIAFGAGYFPDDLQDALDSGHDIARTYKARNELLGEDAWQALGMNNRLLTPVASMKVIAVTVEATYIRLPRELQASCGLCACPRCDGAVGYWDTLVIPNKLGEYTWTGHMLPSASDFRDGLIKLKAKQA